MIKVNLLPFRAARRKENIRRQVVLALLSLCFALVVLMYYHINLNGQIATAEAKIKTTQRDLNKYQKITRDIANIKQRLQVLNQKRAVISSLEAGRKEPVLLLETMTKVIVPKRMWFTFLNDKNNVVTIKGNALDNKTVADFMTRLEKTGLFTSVNLKTLTQQKLAQQDITLKSFEITCNKLVAAPGPKK